MLDPVRGAAEPPDSAPRDDTPGGDPAEQPLDVLADGDLLERVRAGDDAAFGTLYVRHAPAVRAYASRHGANGADADDLAAEAFFRVLQTVRKGSGPVRHARGYLLTVTRRVAAEWAARREVTLTDQDLPVAEPAIDRVERSLITAAFISLPERWRAVLWRVEVEGERPSVVARSFGLSANATAALARRARHGLRAAYLQAHLSTMDGSSSCRGVTEKLGAYTSGGLRGSETRRVRAHLAGCSSCRALQTELSEVCAGLRVYASALLVPAAVTALLAEYGGGAGVAGHAVAGNAVTGKALTLKASAVTLRTKVGVLAASASAIGAVGLGAGPLLSMDRDDLGLEGRHNVIAVSPAPSGEHSGRPSVTTPSDARLPGGTGSTGGGLGGGGGAGSSSAGDGAAAGGATDQPRSPSRPERGQQPEHRDPAGTPETGQLPTQNLDDPPASTGAGDIRPTSAGSPPQQPPPEPVLTTESFAPPPPPLIEVSLLPLTDLLNPGPVSPPVHDQPTESYAPQPHGDSAGTEPSAADAEQPSE